MFQEINIDIGSGEHADFFVPLAGRNRNALYVALDPKRFRCPYPNLYPNLRLMIWRSGLVKGENWEIPFRNASVDNAHLNNIFGVLDEIKHNRLIAWYLNQDEDIYHRVVLSLKRIMKPMGRIYVREARGLIPIVQEIYMREGFSIIDGPKISPPENFAATSGMLLGLAERSKEGLGASCYLPMEFVAVF